MANPEVARSGKNTYQNFFTSMKITIRKTYLLLISTLAPSIAFAETWIVDNNENHPADFRSAQEAHDSAAPGDTLLIVGSATTYGNLTMDRQLKLTGPGYFLSEESLTTANHHPARFDSIILGRTADTSSAESRLVGLSCNTVEIGVDLSGGPASAVSGVIIDQCKTGYIDVHTDQQTSNIIVKRSLIESSFTIAGGTALISNSFLPYIVATTGETSDPIPESISSHTTITQSVIVTADIIHDSATISISNSILFNDTFPGYPGISVTYSLVHQNIAGWFSDPTNHTYTAINEQVFINATQPLGTTDRGLRLIDNENNPAKGIALGGGDAGMFGGPDPYILSGVSSLPRVTSFISSGVATETSGLKVRVGGEVRTSE